VFNAIGTHKYLEGSWTLWNSKICVKWHWIGSLQLKKNKFAFSLLMRVPEVALKVCKKERIPFTSLRVVGRNKKTSSTNWWWVTGRSAPKIIKPLIWPYKIDLAKNRLSPSITRINKKGDRGSPWHNPHDNVKVLEGEPMIRNLELETYPKSI